MPIIPDAAIKCAELARFAAAKGLVETQGGRDPKPRTLFVALSAAGGPKVTTMRDSLSKSEQFSDANSAALLRFLGLAEDFRPWFEPLEGESREAKTLWFRKKLSPHRRMPRLASVNIEEASQSSNAQRVIHAELTFNQITPPEPEDGEGESASPLKGLALCLAEAAVAMRFSEDGMRARRGTRLESKPGVAAPLSSGGVSLVTVMSPDKPVWIVKAQNDERLFGTIYTMEAPLFVLEGAPVGSTATASLNICSKNCALEPVEPDPSVDIAALDIARSRILCILESKAILEDDESFTHIVHDHTIEMRDHDGERSK